MKNILIDKRIQHEFQSILKLLVHFSLSLIQLVCAFGILSLQIILVTTQTCSYVISTGFWSMPFLLLTPLSIWIVIWRRSSVTCFIAIIIHFIATLFMTSIIIISLFVLIKQSDCSISSLTMYYIPLNSSFIGIAVVFKIFNYAEIILLHRLLRTTDRISTICVEDVETQNYSFAPTSKRTSRWYPWSTTTTSETQSDLDYLFI